MKLEKLVTQGKRNADLDAEEKMANCILLDNTVVVAIYGFVGDDILEKTCQVFDAEGPWRFLNVIKAEMTITLELFSSPLDIG
ncbi:hypothetical protein BOTNAR_0282g00020 [Botryotinia narcissicola]|uniref:Uncharacterized protein n=1 Tax=Botryotinia narcissicola TaxID=278944 RepID=A0A4Z1HXG4_9HELO|nr:hypothetical protein BOTNAR_0282g00020 [Botryotinia narcissicola]